MYEDHARDHDLRGVPPLLWSGAYRGTHGVYGSAFRFGLLGEFGSMDDRHIDTLTGYAAPTSAVAVLSTEETAMRAKLVGDSLLKTELGDEANYLMAHPEDGEMVRRNVNCMLNDYTATQHQAAQSVALQVEQARQRLKAIEKWGPRSPAVTTAEYKQRNEPLSPRFSSSW